jgi:hypothetical protein
MGDLGSCYYLLSVISDLVARLVYEADGLSVTYDMIPVCDVEFAFLRHKEMIWRL